MEEEPDLSLLQLWEEQMAEEGEKIYQKRKDFGALLKATQFQVTESGSKGTCLALRTTTSQPFPGFLPAKFSAPLPLWP